MTYTSKLNEVTGTNANEISPWHTGCKRPHTAPKVVWVRSSALTPHLEQPSSERLFY
jgi:hypothetical protein